MFMDLQHILLQLYSHCMIWSTQTLVMMLHSMSQMFKIFK